MGLGICYTIAKTEKQGRAYWRGWPIHSIALSRRLDDGRVIVKVEADCGITVTCDQCKRLCCVGCNMQVSIDISCGEELVTCLRCWEPDHAEQPV